MNGFDEPTSTSTKRGELGGCRYDLQQLLRSERVATLSGGEELSRTVRVNDVSSLRAAEKQTTNDWIHKFCGLL